MTRRLVVISLYKNMPSPQFADMKVVKLFISGLVFTGRGGMRVSARPFWE